MLYKSNALVIDCNDASACVGKSYVCTDELCEINCNADLSCQNTHFECDDSYLHSQCKVNCMGNDGCENMSVESHRDINVLCGYTDSCDKMTIDVYGDNPNDKIFGNVTSIGSYTDETYLTCYGDGIQECFLDCRDNGDYYSCIEVTFDCYTPGICRYRCESSNACCGCQLSLVTKENALNCYYGDTNCIQEDPGGCYESYGCVALYVRPTPSPTPSPTPAPTGNPTPAPTGNPTLSPTPAPTSNPTPSPTDNPTPAPTSNPTLTTSSPTLSPTNNPTLTPTDNPTKIPSVNPTKDPSLSPSKSPNMSPTRSPDTPIFCLSLTLTITDLVGVETNDYIIDNQLQSFVMNNTKSIIFRLVRGSFKYNVDEWCQDFWECFYLDLKGITGNTVLQTHVCSYTTNVYNALYDKIREDIAEMEAYMTAKLKLYFTESPSNGYDANTNNLAVSFVIETTTTTVSDAVVEEATTTVVKEQVNNDNNDNNSSNSLLIIVILIVVILFLVAALIALFALKRLKERNHDQNGKMSQSIEMNKKHQEGEGMLDDNIGDMGIITGINDTEMRQPGSIEFVEYNEEKEIDSNDNDVANVTIPSKNNDNLPPMIPQPVNMPPTDDGNDYSSESQDDQQTLGKITEGAGDNMSVIADITAGQDNVDDK